MITKQTRAYDLLFNYKLSGVSLILVIFFFSSFPHFSQAFSSTDLGITKICLETQVDIDHSHSNSKESKNLITWEEEQKEEKLESEINTDCTFNVHFIDSPINFFKISGAERAALKIPHHKSKTPYYLLFHCLKIHLG